MVWEIIEFDNAAYARKLRGRRKQDVQEKHLAIKRRLLSSMTAAGVGLAASIHTVGISTAFAGISLRRADILRQKKKILEEHMACNGWEEIDMELGDVALAVGPIAVASAVAPGVEHLTTHLAGHGATDFIAQNIGHTVHAAEHAPGAFADAVAGGVHDQAAAVLHGLGGDPTNLVSTYDVMNSSVQYAGNAVGQAGAQYAEIQAAEHGSEALAKKLLQRQTKKEAKARAAAEKASSTALRNSTDKKNVAGKTCPEVKASSDRTVSNTKQFTSNSTSFPTPPGVDPSQLRYLQAFKSIPTNNTSSPSEEGPMRIWPSSAAFLLLTLLFHGPPTINSIFGHEAAFVWAAPFIFLALTLKDYKRTFLTAMGMMALIAFLYPPTDLWTHSLILQACVAVKQYRLENLAMRSPGFRVRHVDEGPLDCWPGTLCNALFSLYMLSSWSEEGYAFISGAMLISLILSATHLRPAEPITMDLAYPKRALLDLLYNPINIAAILAPVCICSEDNTSLYTGGGLTAALIIHYLRSRIMDTTVERLGYEMRQSLFNGSVFRIILRLIAASGCVYVWWIVLPGLVFWTAAAIMVFIRSPWVV